MQVAAEARAVEAADGVLANRMVVTIVDDVAHATPAAQRTEEGGQRVGKDEAMATMPDAVGECASSHLHRRRVAHILPKPPAVENDERGVGGGCSGCSETCCEQALARP